MDYKTLEQTLDQPYCQYYSVDDVMDLFDVPYDQVIRTKRFEDMRANWPFRTRVRRFPRAVVNAVLEVQGIAPPVVAGYEVAPTDIPPFFEIYRGVHRTFDVGHLCQLTGLSRDLILAEVQRGTISRLRYDVGDGRYLFDRADVLEALGLDGIGLWYWTEPVKVEPIPSTEDPLQTARLSLDLAMKIRDIVRRELESVTLEVNLRIPTKND